jgi:hypothetical protein
MRCFVCGGNADKPGKILLGPDGDFACGQRCKDQYERDKAHFFNSVGDDEKYAAWMAEGGVDVKQHGPSAWKSK